MWFVEMLNLFTCIKSGEEKKTHLKYLEMYNRMNTISPTLTVHKGESCLDYISQLMGV